MGVGWLNVWWQICVALILCVLMSVLACVWNVYTWGSFEKGHSKTPLLCSSLWYQFYICRSAYCVIQGPVEQLCRDQNTHSCLPYSDSAEKITVSGQWCKNTEPSIWWEDARTPCVPFVQEWFKVWIGSFSSLPFVLLLVKLYACTCNYCFLLCHL